MKYRVILAMALFWPMHAIGGANIVTEHIEDLVSQETDAPDCLGLPAGAKIQEEFLNILDIRQISRKNGTTVVLVAKSSGVAFANDDAWMWEISMHRADVFIQNDSVDKTSIVLNRLFISKQIGVPNLHRTFKLVVVLNAQGVDVVDIFETDFVCSP